MDALTDDGCENGVAARFVTCGRGRDFPMWISSRLFPGRIMLHPFLVSTWCDNLAQHYLPHSPLLFSKAGSRSGSHDGVDYQLRRESFSLVQSHACEKTGAGLALEHERLGASVRDVKKSVFIREQPEQPSRTRHERGHGVRRLQINCCDSSTTRVGVRASNGNDIGSLREAKRVNVAILRAKLALFVLGDMRTVARALCIWIMLKHARERVWFQSDAGDIQRTKVRTVERALRTYPPFLQDLGDTVWLEYEDGKFSRMSDEDVFWADKTTEARQLRWLEQYDSGDAANTNDTQSTSSSRVNAKPRFVPANEEAAEKRAVMATTFLHNNNLTPERKHELWDECFRLDTKAFRPQRSTAAKDYDKGWSKFALAAVKATYVDHDLDTVQRAENVVVIDPNKGEV
ncbi:uncharacterized protein EV422DRAFT_610831 [Fimicolochytrium jonesii]|uniref:uncharacterized protein n=1 Tax=Fimicolochytrium jonesii TaxID=1396493 RepID=UPI0022FEC828|nr:uncharacterized protein EV422DRAFT_610831 [Fimicolochytrium jonesii]KAI8815739.1 hypothetical protein EV422DRAFT_610831 [Fimicolochytrium jonesii]